MGMTLDTYPPADLVLAAHAEALGTLPPTPARRRAATRLRDVADGRCQAVPGTNAVTRFFAAPGDTPSTRLNARANAASDW